MTFEKYYGNLFFHSGSSNNYFCINGQKLRVVKVYYFDDE